MRAQNFVRGQWVSSTHQPSVIPDPLNRGTQLQLVESTSVDELQPFRGHLFECPKSGLHNPLKHPQRLVAYGQVAYRLAEELEKPEVEEFFAKLIQRVMPKSTAQCLGEVRVTKQFLKSFAGDSVRFSLGRSFAVSGDHAGQQSHGYRWPYGPVMVIAPFNFPLEIPVLQVLGALFAGNRVLLKPSEKVAIVMDQFVRLMLHCGMDAQDLLVLNSTGKVAQEIATDPRMRLVQFTGSGGVAERLSVGTGGKVRIEDAGFNWKLLGPKLRAYPEHVEDYIVHVCDQDAYAASGQKCSATSCLFVHSDWQGVVPKLAKLAGKRNVADLTIGPVLSWTNEQIRTHLDRVLQQVPNARIEFGGKALAQQDVPEHYGMIEPTAIRCHVRDVLSSDDAFAAFSVELFGPFQIIVDYGSEDVDLVLKVTERLGHHLTCAVVSEDPNFCHRVLSSTVNGTSYVGMRARTTGAPTNHWFGPAGDPRGAGIGTVEAILHVWTCHREIVNDVLEPSNSKQKLVQS